MYLLKDHQSRIKGKRLIVVLLYAVSRVSFLQPFPTLSLNIVINHTYNTSCIRYYNRMQDYLYIVAFYVLHTRNFQQHCTIRGLLLTTFIINGTTVRVPRWNTRWTFSIPRLLIYRKIKRMREIEDIYRVLHLPWHNRQRDDFTLKSKWKM